MEKLQSISNFAESELNAVVLNKKINDELRGFKHPYSATILGYENDEKSVLNLVQTVTGNFPIAQRFYRLKAKMMGLSTLSYADRAAQVGKVHKKISFEKACVMLGEVLESIDTEYKDIFERMIERGQIDVYPKKGKSGGAYCSHGIELPTMVLLNHTDDMRSFTTLAHEMGHAIHSEMSKSQSPLYEGYSTAVAETASTFFEQLAFEELFKKLTDQEKITALHDKINDDVSTIFRQITFFNFELELHSLIREKGSLSHQEIASLLNKHTAAYMGSSVKLEDIDGYFFAEVSHFRRFFYVYSYAYGQLISKSLVRLYQKDLSYAGKIKEFLKAGGSKTPEQIFKDIGIDVMRPSFFEEGLKGIEEDIKKLERLVRKT